MQVVDELTSRVSTSGLSLERITLAGPSACDYSGPGGHDLVHSVALALDADTSVLPSEAEGHETTPSRGHPNPDPLWQRTKKAVLRRWL